MLFVLFSTTQIPVLVVAVLFALIGLWWLMGNHWDRLAHSMAMNSHRVVPVRSAVLALTIVLLLLAAGLGAAWSRGATPRLLTGFMPTSGGDRWGSVYGRGGVGDGDQLVGAEDHASAFGPVETDLFLSSEQPSLYDTFSDMYGEPYRSQKQRTISLDSATGRESDEKMAQSKQAAREFPAVRQRPTRRGHQLEDRDSDALLFVVGVTPLHLRLETYDHFDGVCWSHALAQSPQRLVTVKSIAGKPWMKTETYDPFGIYVGKHTHAVKVMNLATPRIPAPVTLAAWHIDRVDQRSFFDWTPDDVLQLSAHDRVPELTVVHLVSQGIDVRTVNATQTCRRRGSP